MRVLITAGPTREYLDDVRYLSNASSGRMGYAIASAAVAAGHEVVLISGPVSLAPPAGCHVVSVETTRQMGRACLDAFEDSDGVVAVAAVCASIGLQIHFRTLVDVGWRVAVTAGAAWVTIAGLSLGLLVSGAAGVTAVNVAGGLVVLSLGFTAFRRWGPTAVSLRGRLDEGEPLTLREAVEVLDLLDREGPVSESLARRVMDRVQPAIGELVSLRESLIQGGINYRRLTYWRSPEHGSSLVGILWTPGTTAHIHSHNYSALGRRIEGTVEVVEFARAAADRLRVIHRTQLGASTFTEFTEGDTVHLVRNVGAYDAVDLHFCGPRGPHEASRYTPREADPTLAVGQEFAVDIVEDRLPVVMSVPGE